MAEALNKTEIEATPGKPMTITVVDYDSMGKAHELTVPIPTSANFREWSLMQQVAMLKKGLWSKSSVHEIMFGIAYSNSFRDREDKPILDIMQGDVYPTGDGRIAKSNKAKIKIAQSTGLIVGIQTDIVELEDEAPEGCILDNDIECTATVTVKGWQHPIVRKARLSRWFKAKNANWKENPEHMLELNTVAHACEYVSPTGTGEDEAPPPVMEADTGHLLRELKSEIEEGQDS